MWCVNTANAYGGTNTYSTMKIHRVRRGGKEEEFSCLWDTPHISIWCPVGRLLFVGPDTQLILSFAVPKTFFYSPVGSIESTVGIVRWGTYRGFYPNVQLQFLRFLEVFFSFCSDFSLQEKGIWHLSPPSPHHGAWLFRWPEAALLTSRETCTKIGYNIQLTIHI